ncbi:DapH/DapD/GlmU-related protein [Williamsia muralis]|uniref:DapH/DapD/GlmU-related protein n=1 Tax=Williamsia marianensis TaxID=85044 RepID=A0ABU4EMQ4_WILMA|nr:DapH/DapD/GlmU-related protein [Williamsia muralis]MDV7132534.1 DapH/DapD/GlmU-related protein [Williamsia muralis]
MTNPQLSLDSFTGAGYEKGRGRLWQVLWLAVRSVFQKWWMPAALRVRILRAFGAEIGTGVLIRHDVTIHWPWKLTIGDNSWIGEGAWILNLEPVVIGRNCCISQSVFLCTGSHDRNSPSFEFDNAPITIEDGAWVAARATVLRGVTVGRHAVVGACALVSRDISEGVLVLASPSQWKQPV